jgi:hypothetical protein
MNATLDFDKIRKTLRDYVDEMYFLEKGVFVDDFEQAFRFGDGSLNRRQVKHIIEQRRAEMKSIDEIKEIFDYIPVAVANFDFEMPNQNKKYPGSVLRFKIFQELERGIAVVMDKKKGNKRDIITAYLCSPKKIYLKQKKLNASAAGETPHS